MTTSFQRAHAQEWPDFMLAEDDLSNEWQLFARTTLKDSDTWDIWQITWYKGIYNKALFSLQVHYFSNVSQAINQYSLLEMTHRGEGWKNITSTSFEESGFARWFARTAYEAHRLCVEQVVNFYFLGQYGKFLIYGGHTDVATYRWSDTKTIVEAQLVKITLTVSETLEDADALQAIEKGEEGAPGFNLYPILLALGLIGIFTKRRRRKKILSKRISLL
ncbi:MAG: hypothetical protein ACFFB3_03765 [Candidatus Hodarchaeota archaeon]